MPETVIVPIALDHPEKAHDMIAAAKKLGGDGCRILLLSVIEKIPSFIAAELPEGFGSRARDITHKELLKIAAEENIPPDIEVIGGVSAHREILRVAEDTNASAIIIGSHRPGFEDYILGSTTARVVRHAKCNVLVLRGDEG